MRVGGGSDVPARQPVAGRPGTPRPAGTQARRPAAQAAVQPPRSPRPVLGARLATASQARALSAATADLVGIDGWSALEGQANLDPRRVHVLTGD